MENNKEDLIVILAGYKDRMDKFFGFIPGMSSRVGNHIDFPNYNANELLGIAQVMVRELDYQFDHGSEERLLQYLDNKRQLPFFANARTVRNAVDRARMIAAVRVFNEGVYGGKLMTEQDFMMIKAEDFD